MPRRSADRLARTKGGSLVDVHLWLPRELVEGLRRLARKRQTNRRDLAIEAIKSLLKPGHQMAVSPTENRRAVDT